MDAFWYFAKMMLRFRWYLVLAMSFALISAGGMATGIAAIQPVLDTILEPDHNGLPDLAQEYAWTISFLPQSWIDGLPEGQFIAIVWVMSVIGLLTVIGAFAKFMHQFVSFTVVHRTVARIRREAFGRVIHLPLKTIVQEGPTDAISRIVNDTEALSAGFVVMLSKAVAQILQGAMMLLLAFLINWQLALISLTVMPILATVIRKLGKRIRRASNRVLTSRADLYRASTEALQGLRVVKVHTTERYESGRFGRFNKEVLRQQLKVRTARSLAGPLVEVIAVLALGVLVIIAAKFILDGVLDKGEFMTTLVALGVAAGSVKPISGMVNDIQQSGAAADRLYKLMQAETEPGHDKRMPKLARHHESIVFDNVSVLYPGATHRAVADVSLRIEHGETVAFVGPNGCGKTSLLSLVPRLFDPNTGRVLIDGIDIARVRVRSLRKQIGVVTQEVVLFKGTIRDNIAYGNPSASEEQIRHAAEQARAMGFIERLPEQFDTMVGEQGLTLSGGQRQRLAIARAILREPAILILDEATSMVDAQSEKLIGEVLDGFCKHRTSLIVAHRLSTVLGADRIVVLDQGRVVGQGTHDELLDSCPLYRELATHQLASSDKDTSDA
jgi:ABC-type multidrug transport system fused ATPase/permease subunit